ncbi:MAG: hypothetical protein WEA56_08960 [Balneolaceae bacterium]
MFQIINQLEDVLNIGYTILSELEEHEPNLDEIDRLYEKRTDLLTRAKDTWKGISKKNYMTNLKKHELDAFKNMFLRLNLLEQTLNRNLETLKREKSEALSEIDSLRYAQKNYNINSNRSSMSLFVDFKSNA